MACAGALTTDLGASLSRLLTRISSRELASYPRIEERELKAGGVN
jgi:hypothetical protein